MDFIKYSFTKSLVSSPRSYPFWQISKYTFAVFRISSATEVWQRRTREFVEGLERVEVFADDLLMERFGNTDEEVSASLHRNKRIFLKKYRE